jgi:hypothetical protein
MRWKRKHHKRQRFDVEDAIYKGAHWQRKAAFNRIDGRMRKKMGVKPKRPADSGKASWLCDVCGHHRIGSLTDCEIGDWLRLRPLQPNAGG